MISNILNLIYDDAQALANSIVEYSISQREKWRLIPALTRETYHSLLEYVQKTDYLIKQRLVINNGLYPIDKLPIRMYVDLDSGRLVQIYPNKINFLAKCRLVPADIRYVVMLAFSLNEINADYISKKLCPYGKLSRLKKYTRKSNVLV